MVAKSNDISNTAACVEAVFRSHIYITITAMQYCYTKMLPGTPFIIWVDWSLDKIKKHHETTKMFMNRVEIGKDGKQEEKDRKLLYLTNGSSAFCLSYAIQALQVHNDEYICCYGLQMKRDQFLFTEGKKVRYVLLTYTKESPFREWITKRLTEPVMIMRD